MRRLILAATALLAGSPLAAAEPCETLDSKAVAALFDDWNFALSSLNADQVVQRYWPDAVLLPTVSNTPRTNAAMIGDYFEHFLAKRPRGRIDTRTIQSGCNVAMDVGTYTFSLMDSKGVTSEVAARYTFIYQYRDGGWKIVHHHSSAMPESGARPAPAEGHAAMEPPKPAPKPARVASAKPAPAVVPERPKRTVKEPPKPAASPTTSVAPATPAAKAAEEPKVESRTAMFANLSTSPAPAKFYPPEAAKKKEQGNVNLKVCSDDTGAVAGVPEILKSSGSKLLDDAALEWARAAKWVPATLNQRRVEGCTQVDVAFEAAA
jgi:uncharacterized protein (TIGR02246 family)